MKIQKWVFSLLSLGMGLVGFSASAADLTSAFKSEYQHLRSLSANEQVLLETFDIYLVPGILSETFLSDDGRSKLTFAGLTGDYLEAQRQILKQNYGFLVKRLPSSSRSPYEIRQNIRRAIKASWAAGRKAIFMTHSLGGLALLEELLTQPAGQGVVAGVIFLQSPFYGTPIADLYFEKRYDFDTYLKPVLPFLNTTEETLRYLGTSSRGDFMERHKAELSALAKNVRLLTVAGTVNRYSSLFQPTVTVMARGCLATVLDRCWGPSLYEGLKDYSDGMVPLESTKLPGVDYVVLEGVDHGETVVNIPFTNYDKGRMTEVLFSMLARKLSRVR